MESLRSPLSAQIVQWLVAPGDVVRAGDVLVVLEAMKMEHEVRASSAARVLEIFYSVGEAVQVGDVLMRTEPGQFGDSAEAVAAPAAASTAPRADLERLLKRQAFTQSP